MMAIPRPLPLCCVIFLTLAAALNAANEPGADAKYAPLAAPRFKAGDAFSYRATAEYSSLQRITKATKTTVADEKNPKKGKEVLSNSEHKSQDDYSAEFIADSALARTVFKNGSLADAVFLVRRCLLIDDKGQTQTLLQPGTILGAHKQKDGQVAFAVNGKQPDSKLARELSVLIPMGDEQATANELLTSSTPVSVGAHWPVNEKAMLHSELAQIFPGVDRVGGGVTFLSAHPDETGIVRTSLASEYRLGDVKPPLPPDVQAAPSDVAFNVIAVAPAAGGPGQYDVTMSVLVHHSGFTGDIVNGMSETDVEFSVSVKQTLRYILGPVGAANPALANAPAVPTVPPLASAPGLSSAQYLRPQEPKLQNAPDNIAAPAPPSSSSLLLPSPTLAAPSPKPAAPANTTSAPPALIIPKLDSSPFSGAQDLPSSPAK